MSSEVSYLEDVTNTEMKKMIFNGIPENPVIKIKVWRLC